MALISLRQLLDHAATNGYGVPAFNVNNMEQVRAIMEAASETDSPVILQSSAGARKYAGSVFLRHLILAAIEEWPTVPVCLHLDHGASPAVCAQAIQNGFSSVMMDGSLMEDSSTPSSYEYNVAVTRAGHGHGPCLRRVRGGRVGRARLPGNGHGGQGGRRGRRGDAQPATRC